MQEERLEMPTVGNFAEAKKRRGNKEIGTNERH